MKLKNALFCLLLVVACPSVPYQVVNAQVIAPVATITPEMRDMSTTTIKTLAEGILGQEMMPILACESGFRQFDSKGIELRSKTFDVGVAQINIDTWGLKAKELGFNIYQPLDNLRMAKYILDTQGITAWTCTKLLSIKT